MKSPRRILVLLLVLTLVGVVVLGGARTVLAAQNRPAWAPGDYWVYTGREGNFTATLRETVRDRVPVTVGSGTYSTWHSDILATVSNGGTTITVTLHKWVTEGDLATVRENSSFFFQVTTTYDPPKSLAVFPLIQGATWTKTTTKTTVSSFGTQITTETYSGLVTQEVDTTVPAGTFHAAVIRSPASGNPYTLSYYAESVGNFVRLEEYDANGNLQSTTSLAEYRYGAANPLLTLAIVIMVATAALLAAVALLAHWRRKTSTMPPVHGPRTMPEDPIDAPQFAPPPPPDS